MSQRASAMDVDDDGTDLNNEPSQASGSTLSTPRIPAVNYKERLIITKIVMENFKSYAGVQEIGPLHHCFTAIVGPNGSGKSNVIDAILFVFGRQAKQLRLARVSEFIHNSDNHKNLDYARVSVHFQSIQVTDDDQLVNVVPNSDFVLTRVAHKNNQSEYRLNRKQAKREEVVELLKSKGVDLDNSRFLILQGEVEQISLMKSKAQNPNDTGLLEYLEEIIGSNKYVEDIDKAYQELEQLNEQKQQKSARVKLAEKEMSSLKGAFDEAHTYLEKQKEICDKKSIVYQLQRAREEKRSKKARDAKVECEQKLNEHRAQMEKYKEQAKEAETVLKTKVKEHEKIGKEMEKAKSDWTAFERKDVKMQEDINHLRNKLKSLDKTIAQREKELSEKKAGIKASQEDVARLEAQHEKLSADLEKHKQKLETMYESLNDETKPLQEKLDAKQTQLMPFKKKLHEAESKLGLANSEYELSNKRSKDAEAQYEQAVQDVDNLLQTIDSRKKEIVELKGKIKSTQQKLANSKQKLTELTDSDAEIAKQVRNSRSELEELQSSLQQSKSQNKVLKGLLQAKSQGQIDGIVGRLGDLGTIDAKYDVAISTAAGSALDNIVVRTSKAGQLCVDYLRKYNLGRATFIILEKIREEFGPKSQQPVQIPDNAKRLYDLIKVKEKDKELLPAFYFAVRDTLVSDNLDIATKIAFSGRRWRVVTLGGELIDVSGTMSGGGAQKQSGGMRGQQNDVDPEAAQRRINKLQKEIDAGTAKLNDIRQQSSSLETEIERLAKELRDMEVDLRKKEMDVGGYTKQHSELSKRIPELEKARGLSKEEQASITALEKQIAEFEREVATIQKQSSKLQEEVKAIQKEIDDAGGIELKSQKAKVESLEMQLDSNSTQLTKLKVSITAAEKAIKKADAARQAAVDEKQDTEVKLADLVASHKALEIDAEAVHDRYQQAEANYEETSRLTTEAREQFDKVNGKLSKFRKNEIDLVNNLEDAAKLCKDNEDKIALFTDKILAQERKKQELKVDETEDELKVPILTQEEQENYKMDDLQNEIHVLQEEVNALKPDMSALRAYREKSKVYEERVAELNTITAERDEKRTYYEDLRKRRLDEFMAGFSIISLKLREMYRMITLGGDAELELIDSLDPFREGINFSVRPPNKSWKNIQNLSGGEKTLSSLALVFALHYYKPTPIYIMDEIDAALDFKNVSIVANYIKERTRNAQFLIVSLRNYMFELADRLVGIYKTDNATKSVTINPKAFAVPEGHSGAAASSRAQ